MLWEVSPIRRYGRQVIAIVVLSGGPIFLGADPGILIAVGAIALVFMMAVVNRNLSQESVKQQRETGKNFIRGGWCEFRIAWRIQLGLMPHRLAGRGPFFVMADRAIDKSNANWDIGVLGRMGFIHVDAKKWFKPFKLLFGFLCYGGQRLEASSTKFETGEIRKAVNRRFGASTIPVHTCWAIETRDRFKVVDESLSGKRVHKRWKLDEVELRDKTDVVRYVVGMDRPLSRQQAKDLYLFIDEKFPKKK